MAMAQPGMFLSQPPIATRPSKPAAPATDSIEAVAGAAGFDGLVAIGGCDKNMPGCAMAMARLNRPAIFVYGGTIRPGAQRRDIVSVFEAVGAHAAGTLSDAGLLEIERTAIPGAG